MSEAPTVDLQVAAGPKLPPTPPQPPRPLVRAGVHWWPGGRLLTG